MIEVLEQRISRIKKRADPKVVGVVMFMIFGIVVVFSMIMTNNFKRQKQQLQDEYNKTMYEMVGYVKNVEVELAKLQVTTTPNLTAQTLADIWRQSNLAKVELAAIPVEQNSMGNASKYLTQLSDFSYSLMKQTIQDQKISDEQYDQITQLYSQAKSLANVSNDIYNELNDGRLKWDELEKVSNEKLDTSVESEAVSNVGNIAKVFQQYEGLIYDGAFSDHIMTIKPKYLPEQEVSQQDAEKKIKEIFGEENIESITYIGDSQGQLDLYNFEVQLKDQSNKYNIDITKQGGKLYLMVSDRNVQSDIVSMPEAKKKGLEFLKKLGIEDVKDTYYTKYDNMVTINYAGVQDGVVLYPDLIKVKIALDNGQICSAELEGYIYNHTKREDITPTISMQKAKSVLNKNITVQSEDIAIIPTDSKQEVLTYEFKGSIDERNFIIYINAKTGQEEKVLLIINTPGGVLTM